MLKRKLTNAGKTVVLPLCLFVIFGAIGLIQNNAFLTGNMLMYMLKLTCISAIIALSFVLHLMSGGIDFSIGAIIYLAIITAGNIALKYSLSPWLMLVISITVGIVFSLVVAVLYLLLRMPVIIVSLGCLMVYEALTQMIFGGKGIKILGKIKYAVFGKTYYVYIICAICLLAFWFIMKYTKFGSDTKALSMGQKIAYETGINEKKNVVIRYVISGALLGIAAVLQLSTVLQLTAVKDMGSTGLMFGAMMPTIIGLTLARYSNIPIGVFMGVLSMEIISIGFNCIGFNSTLSTIISGIFLLLFVVVTENSTKILQLLYKGQKRQLQKAFDQ